MKGLNSDRADNCGTRFGNEMYSMLFHANPNVMLVVDPDTMKILEANSAAEKFYGYDKKELLKMSIKQLSESSSDQIREVFENAMAGWQMSDALHRVCGGNVAQVRVFSTTICMAESKVMYLTVFDVDSMEEGIFSEHPQSSKYLHMALHDELTELPNKRFLKMRVEEEIEKAKEKSSGFALIFIDLDNFKSVNDSFGHIAGDKLLSTIGKRLKASVRGHDFASRFGGDEFGIILSGIMCKIAAKGISQRIISCFEAPFEVEGRIINIKCSMGMSVYPEDGADFEELIRAADVEMYNVKNIDSEPVSLCEYCSETFGR